MKGLEVADFRAGFPKLYLFALLLPMWKDYSLKEKKKTI